MEAADFIRYGCSRFFTIPSRRTPHEGGVVELGCTTESPPPVRLIVQVLSVCLYSVNVGVGGTGAKSYIRCRSIRIERTPNSAVTALPTNGLSGSSLTSGFPSFFHLDPPMTNFSSFAACSSSPPGVEWAEQTAALKRRSLEDPCFAFRTLCYLERTISGCVIIFVQ